jgi:hypothetical protein
MITLVNYREGETQTKDQDLIPVDSKEVFIGLVAMGLKPVNVLTDGKKLVVNFPKAEVFDPFQKLQAAMAGVQTPLLVDYTKIVLADSSWKGMLTMMRSIPVQR